MTIFIMEDTKQDLGFLNIGGILILSTILFHLILESLSMYHLGKVNLY
jgi:hypothetical protein